MRSAAEAVALSVLSFPSLRTGTGVNEWIDWSVFNIFVVAKIKNENIQNKPQETVISANENEILAKNPAFLVQKVKKGGGKSPPRFLCSPEPVKRFIGISDKVSPVK